jgi:hypothetical protein
LVVATRHGGEATRVCIRTSVPCAVTISGPCGVVWCRAPDRCGVRGVGIECPQRAAPGRCSAGAGAGGQEPPRAAARTTRMPPRRLASGAAGVGGHRAAGMRPAPPTVGCVTGSKPDRHAADLAFMLLLREPWAEGAIRVSPGRWAGVLGLDRAPEVKTIRRRLGELATVGRADQLMIALARHHTATTPCSSTPASLTSKSPSPGGTSASCGSASRNSTT